MRSPIAIARRSLLALRAGVLLAVLVLGATFHYVHHLQDPGCTDGADRSGHACAVCSGLHGSTVVAARVATPAPLVLGWAPRLAVSFSAPLQRPRFAAAPRAPPQG